MIVAVILLQCIAILSSTTGLSSTPLCGNISDGTWVYGTSESSQYHRCPKISQQFETTTLYRYQKQKYSCDHYLAAVYTPLQCRLLSLSRSFQIINNKIEGGTVVFLGDSLMCQQFMAASCDFEVSGISEAHLRLVLRNEYFMRPNIPCSEHCITNSTYREVNIHGFPAKCAGCPNGIRVPAHYNHTLHANDKRWWINKLPLDTRILIANTGAWYNSYQGISRSAYEYSKTLQVLVTVFERLRQRNIIVVWLALPPLLNAEAEETEKADKYAWKHFLSRNVEAFEAFSELGILFVDPSLITYQRKIYDSNISADGLHWCNAGPTAVPSFINQMIFHTVAMEMLRRK